MTIQDQLVVKLKVVFEVMKLYGESTEQYLAYLLLDQAAPGSIPNVQ